MTSLALGPRPLVVAALPTPFDEDEELAVGPAELLATYLIGSGCDAVFVGGTTGEFPALTVDERVRLVAAVANAVGPERVVAHVGAACAREAERLAARAVDVGVYDIAAASPYFLPAGTQRHIEYYARVATAAEGARLWLYVFPERTGNVLEDEVLARVLDIPGVHGAKVSSPGTDMITKLRAASGGRLRLLSGSDADLIDAFAAGASGLVSGFCCLAPGLYAELADAVQLRDTDRAIAAQAHIRGLSTLVSDGVGAIKAFMRAQGFAVGPPRMAVAEPGTVDLARLAAVVGNGQDGEKQCASS